MGMAEKDIRFNDGAAYERMMGVWSRSAGEVFLDWLKPPAGLRWIDVGCGNGAFTELIVERQAPAAVEGIDPSEAQIAFARTRPSARLARFQQGDAMALPFGDAGFDAAVMALVIFFVPEPARGVAEMARVVRPGGIVCAYAWDVVGGGLPFQPIVGEMKAMGMSPPLPPSFEASKMDVLRELWKGAALEEIETREIVVSRTFAGFEDFWATNMLALIGERIAALPPADARQLKDRVRARLPADAAGRISYTSRANAIKGRVPK
jgi:ubiquinone/menaquinone biosynthesis C-methylase UbiE